MARVVSATPDARVLHIVVFRADTAEAADAAATVLSSMASLNSLEALAVERDLGLHPPAYDLALLSVHRDAEQLRRFREDPGHLSVVRTIADLVPERATIDLAVTGSLTSILHTIRAVTGASTPDARAEQNRDN